MQRLSKLASQCLGENEEATNIARTAALCADLPLDLERLLHTLLSSRSLQPEIGESQLLELCLRSRRLLLDQPVALELRAPLYICGDLHGHYAELLRILQLCGHPPAASYLFLGDYVDRGPLSLETICLLLCYKLRHAERFFLLRGNHESAALSRQFGFRAECRRRYSVRLWRSFVRVFDCLPVAALVDGRIFCCHAGLGPQLRSWTQLELVSRPTDVPRRGPLCDLLWSDPDAQVAQFGLSPRGRGCTFGVGVVKRFCEQNQLELICRGHQLVAKGYEFFAQRRLLTLFSAANYCGQHGNAGAVLHVRERLVCSIRILRPLSPAPSCRWLSSKCEQEEQEETIAEH